MDQRLADWFLAERARVAPSGVLPVVVARTRATAQRPARGWARGRVAPVGARTGPWQLFRLTLAAAGGALVLAVALLASFSSIGWWAGPVGQSPSTAPGIEPSAAPATTAPSPTPRPTPTLAPGAIRIDFKVTGGIVGNEQQPLPPIAPAVTPPPRLVGSGTFTMSGAHAARGTFTDVITWDASGRYAVHRTLVTDDGRLEATANETTFFSESNAITLHGTWRLATGSGSLAGLVASGDVSGSVATSAETWTGTVSP